jgi:hypothetical protein
MKEQTTETQKGESGGWTSFLLENIFVIIRSFVEGAFESVQGATGAFTKKLARRASVIFLVFVGIVFLLVGVARILSELYGFSGAGEVIVGAFILFISLLLYVLVRDEH